ncbi:ABC transporter permease [Methanohalophilus sp.]
MMSGQLLTGASPILAIKYQIAVMVSAYVSTVTCVTLAIFLTSRICFDEYGIPKDYVFRNTPDVA